MESDQWNFELLTGARRQWNGSPHLCLLLSTHRPNPHWISMSRYHNNCGHQSTTSRPLQSKQSRNSHITEFTQGLNPQENQSSLAVHMLFLLILFLVQTGNMESPLTPLVHTIQIQETTALLLHYLRRHPQALWALGLSHTALSSALPQPEEPNGGGRKPEASLAEAQWEKDIGKQRSPVLDKMYWWKREPCSKRLAWEKHNHDGTLLRAPGGTQMPRCQGQGDPVHSSASK